LLASASSRVAPRPCTSHTLHKHYYFYSRLRSKHTHALRTTVKQPHQLEALHPCLLQTVCCKGLMTHIRKVSFMLRDPKTAPSGQASCCALAGTGLPGRLYAVHAVRKRVLPLWNHREVGRHHGVVAKPQHMLCAPAHLNLPKVSSLDLQGEWGESRYVYKIAEGLGSREMMWRQTSSQLGDPRRQASGSARGKNLLHVHSRPRICAKAMFENYRSSTRTETLNGGSLPFEAHLFDWPRGERALKVTS